MNKRFTLFPIGAAMALGLTALPAFAATYTSTVVNTDNGTSVNVSTPGASVSSSGATGASASVSGQAGVTSSASGVNITGSTTSGTVSSSVSAGNGSAQTTVSTDDQLKSYAASVQQADANVQNLTSSSTTVSMQYSESGHLFGFIPLAITVNSTIDASGKVSVSYPWYHFLVSTNDGNLQNDIQARVKATLTADGGMSIRTQEDLMADLEAAFSGEASA